MATGTCITLTSRPCLCPDGRHLLLTTTSTDQDGRIKVSGKREMLKQSGAYPPSLGQAVVGAWSGSSGFLESPSSSSSSGFPVSIAANSGNVHQPSRTWAMQDEESEENATPKLVSQNSGKKRRASWATCCSSDDELGEASGSRGSLASGGGKRHIAWSKCSSDDELD